MRIKEAIHGSELQSFLAQDLKQRVLSPSPGADSLLKEDSKAISTTQVRESLRAAQQAADEVGRMPPEPPTLRARAGAAAVQVVRRLLFWLTPQINSANQAMLSVIQEQTGLIERLSGQIAGLKVKLNEVNAMHSRALERHESEIARVDEDVLGFVKSLDEKRESTRQLLEKQLIQLRTMQFASERRVPSPIESAELVAPENAHSHDNDNLYLLLEDEFRGSREDVKSRLSLYLQYLRAAGAGTVDAPVLDLGCGRAEWLELLRDNGLSAAGVDLNHTFVSFGQELGLDVTLGDVITYLQRRPDNSLGCITGFHIVEHLPWATLVHLVDSALRVLKPGGLAIFETPNPENVQVGSKNFYFDPTHRNPIPAMLLRFLLDARGFRDIEVLHINPYPESMRLTADGLAVTDRLNEFFYGPQDYAVIGRKP